MTLPPAPPQGQMYLFDSVTPPLDDGSYRLTVGTDVSTSGKTPTFTQQHYFDVVGPRFNVPQSMVAGCFPPRNGHGSFQDDLPHIVLSRRTLPWERELDPDGHIRTTPRNGASDPPVLSGPTPWVALLLFEEGEYTYLPNIPLAQAVPPAVFTWLGSPTGVTCDAVEAPRSLVEAILPLLEELQLLAHVRWVNVDDRELNTAGGDGFFAVVVSNRLPTPNAQCRAVLVSLEQRSDIVPINPPATVQGPRPGEATAVGQHPLANDRVAAAPQQPAQAQQGSQLQSGAFTLSKPPSHEFTLPTFGQATFARDTNVRLVALTSWQFTCEGPGTFEQLMQHLDVGMMGTVADPGHPALTDTGHMALSLQDRLGATEQVWYRGPLVPYQLTRDTLGPYHSADQARRATPDTGAEDISYASAFEVGRLLAAADPRLAQALMRWRREAYKQSARTSTIADIRTRISVAFPSTLAETLHTPLSPILGEAAAECVINSHPPIADPYGTLIAQAAPGLSAENVAAAWRLASTEVAEQILGGDPGSLGAVITPQATSTRADTNLAKEAADTAGLARLTAARDQALTNATIAAGGK